MAEFTLRSEVRTAAYTIVKADTLAEAIEIASGREVVIGINCSSEDAKVVWLIEDANGTPENIHKE